MLKANQNEYGLIDNNTRHANNMQANLVFDPVGHIANVFGTGGSWDDLGYWGGKKQAAAADKDLASIKRLEATSERQAKLQMGRVGASTYDQYGYPTQSLYAKGGKLTDPPGGTLSKSDAYWLAVHGSKENAGQDNYIKILILKEYICLKLCRDKFYQESLLRLIRFHLNVNLLVDI